MTKNKKTLIIVACIAILTALIPILYIAKDSLRGVTDLGPKLKYIGSETTGCPILLIFLVPCAQRPGETYYFATDMTQEELGGYFEGAELVEFPSPGGGGSTGQYRYETEYFRPKGSESMFYVSYFDNDNKDAVIKAEKLQTTDKKYVVSLSDSSYSIAKKALKAQN